MRILYFASLRDQLDCDEEQLSDLESIRTIEDVRQLLIRRGEPWASVLTNKQLLIALNQEICSPDTPISARDELAFMPPVTGG